MTYRIVLPLLLVITLSAYVLFSLAIYRGEFSPIHYYSYDNLEECRKNGAFISNELKMTIGGDSLNQIEGLDSKFYTCKLSFEKFFGFLIQSTNEDTEYRRLKC